jgi:hypothetical protein
MKGSKLDRRGNAGRVLTVSLNSDHEGLDRH